MILFYNFMILAVRTVFLSKAFINRILTNLYKGKE